MVLLKIAFLCWDNKMKINQGKELLIPKEKWVPENEIQGTDEMVLFHPIMEEAFKKITEKFEPKHKIALVSLCTKTRPYSFSRKWKTFKRLFGKNSDLIICSNGGIIPIEYETCYPYLTYDAHGQKKYDDMYVEVIYKRLIKFFSKHKYETIVFNFRPGMRNRKAALLFKKTHQDGSRVFILPTKKTYAKAKEMGFVKGKCFPDLDDLVLEEINKIIKQKNESYTILEDN
jgi:hypothetical protein